MPEHDQSKCSYKSKIFLERHFGCQELTQEPDGFELRELATVLETIGTAAQRAGIAI